MYALRFILNQLFQRTNKEMDNLLDQGREMLNSLVDQRNMIKVRKTNTLLVFIHVFKIFFLEFSSVQLIYFGIFRAFGEKCLMLPAYLDYLTPL